MQEIRSKLRRRKEKNLVFGSLNLFYSIWHWKCFPAGGGAFVVVVFCAGDSLG